jgi:hypothetical protein
VVSGQWLVVNDVLRATAPTATFTTAPNAGHVPKQKNN